MNTLIAVIMLFFIQQSAIQIIHDRQEAKPIVEKISQEELDNRWDKNIDYDFDNQKGL